MRGPGMRQWNVVAGLAITLCVVYAGATVWGFASGAVTFEAFDKGLGMMVTAVLGYLARMLNEK